MNAEADRLVVARLAPDKTRSTTDSGMVAQLTNLAKNAAHIERSSG
jgi:hypothetical protein